MFYFKFVIITFTFVICTLYKMNKCQNATHEVQSKLACRSGHLNAFNLELGLLMCCIYHPFCVHPHISSLGIVALDDLIAIYPLLLIIITNLISSTSKTASLQCSGFSWMLLLFMKRMEHRTVVNQCLCYTHSAHVAKLSMSCKNPNI